MIQELVKFANYLADEAALISRKYFRQSLLIDSKENNSPVTVADREIELRIRDLIRQNYPDHAIIGEEFADISGASEYSWVIDPIDGTVAFTCGKPTYTTLISVLFKGNPLIGIIDQPILEERFSAVHGNKAYLTCLKTRNSNPERLLATNVTELALARLNATTPYMFKTKHEQKCFDHLRQQVKLTSFGGDAYAVGLLAAGYIDIILEADLGYYDVAALVPIVEAAGGVITDWQGKKLTRQFNGQCLIAANPILHSKVLESLTRI